MFKALYDKGVLLFGFHLSNPLVIARASNPFLSFLERVPKDCKIYIRHPHALDFLGTNSERKELSHKWLHHSLTLADRFSNVVGVTADFGVHLTPHIPFDYYGKFAVYDNYQTPIIWETARSSRVVAGTKVGFRPIDSDTHIWGQLKRKEFMPSLIVFNSNDTIESKLGRESIDMSLSFLRRSIPVLLDSKPQLFPINLKYLYGHLIEKSPEAPQGSSCSIVSATIS